jgi:hypothetical protein
MKDFVIIYPKEHKSLVKKLVSKLESNTISCLVSPRDFKQEEKESTIQAIKESKFLLLILDKTAANNPEIMQGLNLALEHNLQIIPFVVGKIDQSIYSSYFFHVLSWVDAYEDSFEEAYEMLLDAYKELSGGKIPVAKKNHSKKKTVESKYKPVLYVLAVIAVLIVAYFVAFNKDGKEAILVGQWNLSNYEDNLPRSPQDSLSMIQNLQNMRNTMKLVFNDDNTFKRTGFPEGPSNGKWELNPERTILYLQPMGIDKKDIVNIEKLTENELVIFVDETLNTVNVHTKIFFTKAIQ